MDPQDSRAVFDRLLAHTHMVHSLVRPCREVFEDLASSLATVMHLSGSNGQLEAVWNAKQSGIRRWSDPPDRILTLEDRDQYLGDVRFERAYVDFFSMENTRMSGQALAMSLYHLLDPSLDQATSSKASSPIPLIYGLFARGGQSLIMLSDALELQTAILVVHSLTVACVTWDKDIYDMMTIIRYSPPNQCRPPDTIINRIAHDPRFSNITETRHLMASRLAKTAVVEYVLQLDLQDTATCLTQLSWLSVRMLCATHKKKRPAFSGNLSQLPTVVHSLHVLLSFTQDTEPADSDHVSVLIRGVWLLMLICYITQLRPVVDESLISNFPVAEETTWCEVFLGFQQDDFSDRSSPYMDSRFLRALRSIYALGQNAGEEEHKYLQAACKLATQWKAWTGSGGRGEQSLNIRL